MPLWADVDEIRPTGRMNDFRAAHDLGDNFVVTYAGTMDLPKASAWSSRLPANWPTNRGSFSSWSVTALSDVRSNSRQFGLNNVRFLPMQPKHLYPQVLAASDVCLSTLHPAIVVPAVPSKIMTIMAAGRPVLAAVGTATPRI